MMIVRFLALTQMFSADFIIGGLQAETVKAEF